MKNLPSILLSMCSWLYSHISTFYQKMLLSQFCLLTSLTCEFSCRGSLLPYSLWQKTKQKCLFNVNVYTTKLAFWKTYVTILRKDSSNWMTQLELLYFKLCGRGLEILNSSSTLMQLKLCQRDRSILNSIKTLVKLILCQRARSILWKSQFLTKGVLYSILADGSL